MKTLYIKDLTAGTPINSETFAVIEKRLATDKHGNQFYDLTLSDKTGQVNAKIWQDNFGMVDKKAIQVGKVVSIKANANEFKGEIQLAVTALEGVDETKLDEYLASSKFDTEEMYSELQSIVNDKVESEHIRQLLQGVVNDPEVMRKLKYWPAGISYHHNYRSGLLQHTLECLAFVEPIKRFYPEANYDIVIAGLILHDIGKLDELDATTLATIYTVRGSALSHQYIGTEYVDKYAPEGMSQQDIIHLKHIILSHNGEKEKGAPTLPLTLEAGIVSSVDETSSMLDQFDKAMKDDTDERGMTGYNRWLGRGLWAGRISNRELDAPNE